MKIYTYKDLIESYKDYIIYKSKNSFYDYYVQRYLGLSKSFGINFELEINNDRKKEDLRQWFVKSVLSTTKSINPFDGLMEAPEYIVDLYKEHSNDFIEAEGVLYKTHFNFQCHLFELIYEKIENTITSKELLENGFDDSKEEPDLADLW